MEEVRVRVDITGSYAPVCEQEKNGKKINIFNGKYLITCQPSEQLNEINIS